MGSPAHVYKEIIEEIIRISQIPIEEKEYSIEELETIIFAFHKDSRDTLLFYAGIAVSNIMHYWADECNDMFNAGFEAMCQIEQWLGLWKDEDDED